MGGRSYSYTPLLGLPLHWNDGGMTDGHLHNLLAEKLDEIVGNIGRSWKSPVAAISDLPSVSLSVIGDALVVVDETAIYTSIGTDWTRLVDTTQVSTGWLSGGAVTRGGGLNLNVAAGMGIHNDDAGLVKKLEWGPTALVMPANSLRNIVVDATGTVKLETVPADFTNELTLASATSDGTSIILLAKHYADVGESIGRHHEYFRDIIGSVAVTGIITSLNATPLRLDVSAGVYYLSDFKVTATATAPITFVYWYQNGSGGWTKVLGQTVIDTANYDGGGGALIPIPGGEYKKDLLFLVHSDDGMEYHVVYGQQTFGNQTDAEKGDIPVASIELILAGARSGGVVSLSGAAVLASAVDHRVFLGQQTQQVSGPVDHGALAGLFHDDHPQYLLADGTRAMAGDFDVGTNNIVNVGTVDGVDVSMHAPRHENGGADEISIAGLSGLTADPQLPNAPTEASAPGTITTTSAADVLMTSMSLTPGAGNYMVWFSTSVDHDSSNESIFASLYVNGVQVADTEREFKRGGAAADNKGSLAFNKYITGVLAGQVVEVRWRTPAATASAYQRTLTLLKVA